LKKRAKTVVIGEIKETMMVRVMQTEDSEDNLEVVIAPDTIEEAIKEVDIKIKGDTKTKEEDIKTKVVAGVIKIEEATVAEKKLGIAIMKMRIKIIIKTVVIKTGEDRATIMDITKRNEAISLKVASRNIARTSDLEPPPLSKEPTCQS
jgi:hypothetical protein